MATVPTTWAATTWLQEEEADCPDLSAIADDLRTVAHILDPDSGHEVGDDLQGIVSDLAEAVAMWAEAVEA